MCDHFLNVDSRENVNTYSEIIQPSTEVSWLTCDAIYRFGNITTDRREVSQKNQVIPWAFY